MYKKRTVKLLLLLFRTKIICQFVCMCVLFRIFPFLLQILEQFFSILQSLKLLFLTNFYPSSLKSRLHLQKQMEKQFYCCIFFTKIFRIFAQQKNSFLIFLLSCLAFFTSFRNFFTTDSFRIIILPDMIFPFFSSRGF